MLSLPTSVILVCADADVGRAAIHNHPLLDLCLGVTPRGTLHRLQMSALAPHHLIGIRDISSRVTAIDTKIFVADLLYEVKRMQATGVFADFENDSACCRALCSALDAALFAQGISFFVPLSRSEDVTHAYLTVETAISGGSLAQMLHTLQAQYGKERIATVLRPVCADFCMPSASSEGTPLTHAQRMALREEKQAQVFFSKELCAKYFTYMDEQSQGHFVLFDDESTIAEKFALLATQDIRYQFALYPDVRPLLSAP